MMLLAFSSAILLTWGVCAVALIGIGSIILLPFESDHSILNAFWIGLGAVVAGLQVYNFLRPVDWIAPLSIGLIGLLGLLGNHHWIFKGMQAAASERSVVLWTCAVIAVAIRAAGPCTHYDTGLYGAAAVRWLDSYPIVPGLANLHFRLGFNSSIFLCIAALERGVWQGQAHHLFVGLLISAFLALCISAFYRLFLERTSSASDWFCAILLIPAGVWAVSGAIVGTNTDIPTAVVALASAAYLIRELERDERFAANAVIASVLISVGLCFKLSAIVFAILAWIVLYVTVWYSPVSNELRTKNVIACLAAPVLILAPWIVRGVLLSGYPFFPAPIFASSASWRVPLFTAQFWSLAMKAWAQTKTMTVQQDWLRLWFANALLNRVDIQLPVILMLCGLAVLVRNNCKPGRVLWILVPGAASTVFWFLSAPDTRFGEAGIWTLAAALAAFAAVFLQTRASLRTRRVGLLLILILAWYSVGFRTPWFSYAPLMRLKHLPPLPHARLITRQTGSGLAICTPAEGDRCWDALPCTPYFDERLHLIRPGEIKSGFASEGKIVCEGTTCSAH